ncbi:tyrosine-type recombinase/integrase [Virgibacillus sp. DJP39]|uniref:tyrosine-type recombinase/integrase n=1 Tax=Virgibacillus sp. DJP39 TaxID=3409790 RepID=UPI003BB7051E
MSENIFNYEEFLKKEGYTSKTIHVYTKEIFYFLDWLKEEYKDEINLEKIDYKHVKDYEDYLNNEREVTNITLNKKRQSLFNFYKWLLEKGKVDENHFAYFRVMKVENRRKTLQYLKIVEIEKIKDVFERKLIWKKEWKRYRDKAMFTVIYDLALKVQEVVDLQLDDIDRTNMIIHVKGNRKREIPLTEETLSVLGDWLQFNIRKDSSYVFTSQKSDHITQNTIHIVITKLREVSGVKDLTANSLRNTRILNWRKDGLGTDEVKRRAGHRNTITTRYYFDKYKED